MMISANEFNETLEWFQLKQQKKMTISKLATNQTKSFKKEFAVNSAKLRKKSSILFN